MSVVTKWLLGKMGKLRAHPPSGPSAERIVLPPPQRSGGMPLMQALAQRQSKREFAATPLSRQQLSELLWAADGINRPEIHERTAPSAMNLQEMDIYVALAEGLYRYDVEPHALELVSGRGPRAAAAPARHPHPDGGAPGLKTRPAEPHRDVPLRSSLSALRPPDVRQRE